MFFRHHCKFQSRNIKFQSPVINLQDGVFNVKVIDIFCFKFLENSYEIFSRGAPFFGKKLRLSL
jgi:hypothetical protein